MQNSVKNQERFSPPCVDNSAILAENKEISEPNASNPQNQPEIIAKNAENSEKHQQNQAISDNNSETGTPILENPAIISLEGLIDRDFKDFEAVFPNISRNSLISDENLRIFAEGKENKHFPVIYAQYCRLVSKIGAQAIKQEQIRQNNAISSVGGLSGTKNTNDGYFTREQVLKMSQDEIKRNFTRIRESQAKW